MEEGRRSSDGGSAMYLIVGEGLVCPLDRALKGGTTLIVDFIFQMELNFALVLYGQNASSYRQ